MVENVHWIAPALTFGAVFLAVLAWLWPKPAAVPTLPTGVGPDDLLVLQVVSGDEGEATEPKATLIYGNTIGHSNTGGFVGAAPVGDLAEQLAAQPKGRYEAPNAKFRVRHWADRMRGRHMR